MKVSFLIFGLLFSPSIIFGFSVSDVTNHGAPEARFYPEQFDQMVLDITIPSGVSGSQDKLLAMTVKNEWTARNIFEIRELVLWKDTGKQGFQGLAIDEEIGLFTFYSNEAGWYLADLNVNIPEQGQRFFVAVEISKVAELDKVFQMKIPASQDENSNGEFEPGDIGIFLESKNNGPIDGAILNPYEQSIRTISVEGFPPKVVITDPLDESIITTSTHKILGLAKDQGGSTPQWVKISINPSTSSGQDWYDVTPIGDNYATWEYDWQDIQEGTYVLKTQSQDWLGNIGISDETTITVAFPVEEVDEPEEEEAVEEPEPDSDEVPSPELETTKEELQVKIAELQAKIKQILQQIIELIQAKISNLKSQL